MRAHARDAGSARALEVAEHLRGVFDHGHDSSVVQPRRADDPEHAGDAPIARAQRRGDHRRAGQRKQLVFRSDEDFHALALLGAMQQVDDVGLGFQIGEQESNTLEVVFGMLSYLVNTE